MTLGRCYRQLVSQETISSAVILWSDRNSDKYLAWATLFLYIFCFQFLHPFLRNVYEQASSKFLFLL